MGRSAFAYLFCGAQIFLVRLLLSVLHGMAATQQIARYVDRIRCDQLLAYGGLGVVGPSESGWL